MPTFSALYALGDALATATVDAFNADSVLANLAYGPRLVEELPPRRLEVVSLAFDKASEQQVYAASAWWDSHFAGDLRVTVVTPRDAAEATATPTHATMVGRACYLLTPKAQIFTATNLPSYEVLAIDGPARRLDFDEATNTDRTELTFRVHLAILASALATATNG